MMCLQDRAAANSAPPLQPLYLVEEITHRVVNEYAEAIAMLSLAARVSSDAQAQAVLSSAADRLRAHVEAHRALQAPLQDGPTELAGYIVQVCACLLKASLAQNGVELTVETEEVWLDADRCWRVGLIVAELIRNAARHGLAGGPGVVRVEIAKTPGIVTCKVSDSGRGLSDAHLGRGRRLVRALTTELGGQVDWAFTPAGCCVDLTFPTAIPIEDLIVRQNPPTRADVEQPDSPAGDNSP
jgi:two-component sensor histidine kinase